MQDRPVDFNLRVRSLLSDFRFHTATNFLKKLLVLELGLIWYDMVYQSNFYNYLKRLLSVLPFFNCLLCEAGNSSYTSTKRVYHKN